MNKNKSKRRSAKYQKQQKNERDFQQKFENEKHSISRARQRYNQNLSRVDEEKIINKIIANDCLYVRTDINSGCEFYYVKHNNVPIKVLYDPTFRAIVTKYQFNTDEYNKLVELNNKESTLEETIPIEVKQDTKVINIGALISSKKVINLTTGKIYNSMSEAAKDYDTYVNYISNACKKKTILHGCKWELYKEENPIIAEESLSKNEEEEMDSSNLLEIFKLQLDTTQQVIKALEENVQLKDEVKLLNATIKENNEATNFEISSLLKQNDELKNSVKNINNVKEELLDEVVNLQMDKSDLSQKVVILENEKDSLKKSLTEEIERSTLLEREVAELKEQLANPITLIDKMKSFFNK